MVLWLSYGLSVLAILLMAVNTWLAFRLRRALIGGEIGERWGLLTNFILVFLLGYVLSPLLLLLQMPVEYMGLVVFVVFLFGAIFVWIVIRIMRDMLSVLGVLEED